MKDNDVKTGILYAGLSYFIWGLLPIYWKLLDHVNADEILINRIIWSFFFMVGILLLTKKWGEFLQVLKNFKYNRKQLGALILASLLISINWFIYIWAVNVGQIIEASLGYYINPLVNVLLGLIVFKERLSKVQYVSFILATIGVLILTISYGKFPWISILLALTFGLYGLSKKMIKVDSSIGLALETMVITPISFIYMILLWMRGTQSFLTISVGTDLLLIGAGAVTAIPLLFFAKGVQRIPLSTLGFLQFMAPTISLILGVFVYNEIFSRIHLISFLFIWLAILIFSLSKTKILSQLSGSKTEGQKRLSA